MKERFIKIKKANKSNYFLYDRSLLKKGKYKSLTLANGGSIINNNVLVGLLKDKNNNLRLKKIGEIYKGSSSLNKIPKLKGGNKNSVKNNLSLKNAIHILRNYYKNNILEID